MADAVTRYCGHVDILVDNAGETDVGPKPDREYYRHRQQFSVPHLDSLTGRGTESTVVGIQFLQWPSSVLKKTPGNRLPHGCGSASMCKQAILILSRAREQADFGLFQYPASVFRAKDLKLSTTAIRNRLLTTIPISTVGIRSKISQATTEAT
jgi:hypothetical protein